MKKLIEKIHQGILNLHNAVTAAARFYKEFLKILRIEQKYDDKYNHQDYNSCYDRMAAMVNDAIEPVKKIRALSACKHRECSHGDNTIPEQKVLAESMTVEDQKKARAWWKS